MKEESFGIELKQGKRRERLLRVQGNTPYHATNDDYENETMSSFFFSTPVDIDIVLDESDDRQSVDVKLDKNRKEKAPLYMDGESVKGAVTVRPKDGKRLEHTGIKVQFTGLIGMWDIVLLLWVSNWDRLVDILPRTTKRD